MFFVCLSFLYHIIDLLCIFIVFDTQTQTRRTLHMDILAGWRKQSYALWRGHVEQSLGWLSNLYRDPHSPNPSADCFAKSNYQDCNKEDLNSKTTSTARGILNILLRGPAENSIVACVPVGDITRAWLVRRSRSYRQSGYTRWLKTCTRWNAQCIMIENRTIHLWAQWSSCHCIWYVCIEWFFVVKIRI